VSHNFERWEFIMERFDITHANLLKLVRRDIGNLLFHFTKDRGAKTALENLKSILDMGKILGSPDNIKSGEECICFTEAPISEFAAYFSLNKLAPEGAVTKYAPYGIAVRKEWLYQHGGRPVIYDDNETYSKLHESIKYKHVPYVPNHLTDDTTWEREWRISTNELELDRKSSLVVVPSADLAFEIGLAYAEEDKDPLADSSYSNEDKPTESGSTTSVNKVKRLNRETRWLVVSLDLFDIKND
jgi:hypothetical protein